MSNEIAQLDNAAISFTEKTLELLLAIRKEIDEFIKDRANNKYEKLLAKYLEDGGIPGYIETPYFYEELRKVLREHEIPHLITPLKDKMGKMIFAKAEDIDKIKELYREILKQKSMVSEISIQEMMDLKSGTDIRVVSMLDEVQTQIIKEKAEKNLVMIAVDKLPNGKYNIFFEAEKEKEMSKMLASMTWELSGKFGHKVREQKQYDIDNKKMIFELARGELTDICITSAKNTEDVIKISKNGYILMKENKILEQLNNDNPDYDKKLWELVNLLDEPVILSNVEYAKEENEREVIVNNRNKRPKFTKEDWSQFKKEMELTALVEKKMSLDNEDQSKVLSSLFNNDVTFDEFFTHELINKNNNKLIVEEMKSHLKEFVSKVDDNKIIEIRVTPTLEKVIESAKEQAKTDRNIEGKDKVIELS